MNDNFYLPRTLISTKTLSETELLASSKYIVVLAEPGGGKTELMKSLARGLKTSRITANVFQHVDTKTENTPLVIDAFDELAKIDKSGIYKLLGKASALNPTHIIVSSRSSEWDDSTSHAFGDFFGKPPLLVRLQEFNESEQKAIFEHHAPKEDFFAFQKEISRFELEPLLPNPQFLKLFADAYIESGRRFTGRRSIFQQAVERLAKEANDSVALPINTISTTQKVELASEVFTKLLLSGAEGVSVREGTDQLVYPLLQSLAPPNAPIVTILATRLFKPGSNTGQHTPIHKIVSEYCAARFLTQKFADPTSPISFSKCLPVIAPNSVVRDELRGLLGWMAALGNKPVEEEAIRLDPYAVLANGDPSQLAPSSKRLLLSYLKKAEEQDPYFRRNDSWRRFSITGLFTQDVLEEIRPLLTSQSDGHLRNLLLELLPGSPVSRQLSSELEQLTLDPEEGSHTRTLACRCLLGISGHDHTGNVDTLVSEGGKNSLEIAAEIIETLGYENYDRENLAVFLRACTTLYTSRKDHRRVIGGRYFIEYLISGLSVPTIEWLLNELTTDLACTCGKKPYECDCRNGISKIAGKLLDEYFQSSLPPFAPKKVWKWLKNLNFHGKKTAKQSQSVKVLLEDKNLRKGLLLHVFGHLSDHEQISEITTNIFGWHTYSHSGLGFFGDDQRFIIDLAYDTNNPILWSHFIARHLPYRENRGPDNLRRHMREQALEKPSFMQVWAMSNRTDKQNHRKNKKWYGAGRSVKRFEKKQASIHKANRKYIQDNRKLVESGQHWNLLVRFSSLLLDEPDKLNDEFGDETLARIALRNCLNFIAPHIPGLDALADLQCQSKSLYAEQILYAACLEIMRTDGSLHQVEPRLLVALRTNLSMHYSAVTEEQRRELIDEVDRIIFPDVSSKESYLRQYVEPQLKSEKCEHPSIDLLGHDKTFEHLRAPLSTEWLKRFNGISLYTANTLFDLAAQYGNRKVLNEIIEERCLELIQLPRIKKADETHEQWVEFWFLRAYYFLPNPPEECWDWLKADKERLFLFEARSGRMGRHDSKFWPKLAPLQIETILNCYIEWWEKVPLPSSWGSDSSKEENAYRFLTELIWFMDSAAPEEAIPVIDRLTQNTKLAGVHNDLKSIRAKRLRERTLQNFEPPAPHSIVELLDNNDVVTVEGLRQLVLEELHALQSTIDGGEYNTADRFYEKGERLGEVRSTEIIAERLHSRLEQQGITITLEHQLKSANRSDFTATKMIHGSRQLLVTEVKGQWHKDLYTAASAQLYDRYSIHPDAEHQGIFLVIWFGKDEKVADRKKHGIETAQELKKSIEAELPQELIGLIDVFVLDVSKTK